MSSFAIVRPSEKEMAQIADEYTWFGLWVVREDSQELDGLFVGTVDFEHKEWLVVFTPVPCGVEVGYENKSISINIGGRDIIRALRPKSKQARLVLSICPLVLLDLKE